MRVINAKDADEAVKLAAETFIEAADARPDAPIGLATGGTMDGIYLKLKELGFRPKTKHAFALDEYEGLEPGSENSYAAELRDKFVERLGWTGTLHVPGTGHYSGETGLELLEQRLTELGPISVQLLGLGSNGHIASMSQDQNLLPPQDWLSYIRQREVTTHGFFRAWKMCQPMPIPKA